MRLVNSACPHSGGPTHSALQPDVVTVAAGFPTALLSAEIERLAPVTRLLSTGNFDVYFERAAAMPKLMHDIARLRELSFRDVGEGTGLTLDIDRFDACYHQLFVWDRRSQCIAGAYRIAFTEEVSAIAGVEGLYAHSLFEFSDRLLQRLGPSLELGRSFVSPDYQGGSQVLRLLWAGIVAVLDRQPEIKVLYGPVSISPRLSEVSRMLIMAAITLHHEDPELAGLVRARHAPDRLRQTGARRLTDVSAGLADPARLFRFLRRLERGVALPVLIKHYIDLKGRFAGFNVDEAFGGTVDGLVFVRVKDIPERMRTRLTRLRGVPFNAIPKSD